MRKGSWTRWVGGLAVVPALALAVAVQAAPYRAPFDPSQYKGAASGPANRVMVLGTPHLSGLPERIDMAWLDPLVERLAKYQPEAIAIEAISGAQCDHMRRFPARYAQTVEDYCVDVAPARAATGLDVPAATAEAERLLATWPAAPTPAQRRHLAAVLMAGGEHISALVQWLRLIPDDRVAGDGLDAALVARLELLRQRRNEATRIAAPLAARLGLERVWNVDDHTADFPTPPAEEKAYDAAITKVWDNPASKQRLAVDNALASAATGPTGMLALYRDANAANYPALVFRSDFGAALSDRSPQRFGRRYVGYWETRNLRMVANIRDVLAQQPGLRLLAIVGASHKGYYEAYLSQMHDVVLQDVRPLLK